MHFCVLRWPSWLGRQTHRVFEQIHWRRHLRHLEVAGSDPVRSIGTSGTMLFASTPLFFKKILRTRIMASRLTTKAPIGNSILQFHSIKGDRVQSCIEHKLSEGILSTRDASIIRMYIAESKSSSGIGTIRAMKLAYTLTSWRRFIGEFSNLDITEVYEGIAKLKEGNSHKGSPFSQNTIYDHIRILKTFLLWMIDNDLSTLPEKKIQGLKMPPRNMMTKVASDLLTPEEMDAMLKACMRSRDRALIITLYEGGFRINELAALKWGDLKFDSRGVVVNTDKKTGKPRYIRLINSKPILLQWKEDYPFEPTPECLVFVNGKNTSLTHNGISRQLRRIAERAGLTKHITPHIFRHTRITNLIQMGMSESVIKMMVWGNMTTNMFRTYAHLTGEDTDQALMKIYGISDATEKKKVNPMAARQCPECKHINLHTTEYCLNCLTPLTEEATQTMEVLSKDMRNHPESFISYMKQFAAKAAADAVAAERARILTPV